MYVVGRMNYRRKAYGYIANLTKEKHQISSGALTVLVSLFHKGTIAVMMLFFTWIVSESDYGEYSVFNSWMGILSVIVTLQLYYGVYAQGLVKFEHDRYVFSSSMQGLTFFL